MPIPNLTQNFLRITHYFTTPTRPVLSVQTFWSSSPSPAAITDALIKDIADEFHVAFGDVWKEVADSVCLMSKTRATYYGILDDGYYDAWSSVAAVEGSVVEPVAGASDLGESDALPDWDALLIRRVTGKRQREHRGRLFIPCIGEDVNSGGVLQPEYYVKANAIAAFIATDFTSAGVAWHGRHWNKKANELEVITQCLVNLNFTTRRDRKVRGLQLTV